MTRAAHLLALGALAALLACDEEAPPTGQLTTSASSSSSSVGGGGTGTGTGTGGTATGTGTGGAAGCSDDEHLDWSGGCLAKACAADDTRRVLFIGNSYTGVNDLPALFTALAAAAGCTVETDGSIIGGARFLDHAQNAQTAMKIDSGVWDHVVLQNQSQVPGWQLADVQTQSVPHAQALVTQIQATSPDAMIHYFVTWGRRDGDAQNCGYHPLVCTFEGHTQALSEGYALYVAATGGDAAEVGMAWKAVVDDPAPPFAATELWSGDGSHPTPRGSYLTAAVLFARIFGASPEGRPYAASLSEDEATYLQGIAASSVP